MTLATYAKKCGVPKKVLESDAYGLIPLMNTKGDKFTEDDVLHALEAYNDSYITYPIDTISQRTGIPIQKNKRNGLKQEQHLYLARRRKEDMKIIGLPMRKEGRPTAEQIVLEWRERYPEGKPKECIAETKLSKNTVYKWWK